MKSRLNVHVFRKNKQIDRELRWERNIVDGRDRYFIEIDWNQGPVQGEGPDMFEALAEVRRQLEEDGWLIGVQGSRYNAYPSGMARDMGGGERIYILYPGKAASFDDLVDTLAPADPGLLATVDNQKKYWRRWLQDWH